MIDVSEIFQAIKHEGKVLSADEKAEIRSLLLKESARYNVDTHTVLHVFTLANEPDTENVELVRRFLDRSTGDYVRQAALIGLVRHWELFDLCEAELLQCLEEMDQIELADGLKFEKYPEVNIAVASLLPWLISKTGNARLRSALLEKAEKYCAMRGGGGSLSNAAIYLAEEINNNCARDKNNMSEYLYEIDEERAFDIFCNAESFLQC